MRLKVVWLIESCTPTANVPHRRPRGSQIGSAAVTACTALSLLQLLLAAAGALSLPELSLLYPVRQGSTRCLKTRGRVVCRADLNHPERESTRSVNCTGGAYAQRPNWRRKYRRVLPFVEARRCVQAIGFSGKDEWDEWVSEGKKSPYLGPYVPSNPHEMYAEEWQGWADFLGVLLDFQSARKVVAALGLKSQEEWLALVDGDAVRLRELRLPAQPRKVYSAHWRGYDHWLGLPESTLYVPKEWVAKWQAESGDPPLSGPEPS